MQPIIMNMTSKQARWLWIECVWEHPLTQDSETRTKLGVAALSHGVTGYGDKDDLEQAARFLETWADMLRQP